MTQCAIDAFGWQASEPLATICEPGRIQGLADGHLPYIIG
jgi:hypothetical protein